MNIMPITNEEFEKGRGGSNYQRKKNYMIQFLEKEYPKAFSIEDLMQAFSKSEPAVYLCLNNRQNLHWIEKKFIGRKAYYRFKKEIEVNAT